jgi:GNAT superfamily N-acetyltransferase
MPAGPEQLTAAQLDEVEPLWAQLHAHHAALAMPPAMRTRPLDASWRDRKAHYARGIAEGRAALFVVRAPDGAPIGYAAALVHDDDRPLLEGESGAVGELDTVVVSDDHRGSGAGASLVAAARDWLRDRGAAPMLIGVRESNGEALDFYAGLGAQPAFVIMALP